MKNLVPNRNDVFYPFQQFFDNFYDDMIASMSPNAMKAKSGYPRWDVFKKDNEWVIEMSVSGCSINDIDVKIANANYANGKKNNSRVLVISGRIAEENQHDDKTQFLVRELRRSSFERSLYLPDDIAGDPEASLKNGILRLAWKIKNKQENSEFQTIKIKNLSTS